MKKLILLITLIGWIANTAMSIEIKRMLVGRNEKPRITTDGLWRKYFGFRSIY